MRNKLAIPPSDRIASGLFADTAVQDWSPRWLLSSSRAQS
jgi:hypothetical protein